MRGKVFLFIAPEHSNTFLKFSLYQNRVFCFNICLTIIFNSLTLDLYGFYLHVFNFDYDVIYVYLWSKFLWRIKLTCIVVLMVFQL